MKKLTLLSILIILIILGCNDDSELKNDCSYDDLDFYSTSPDSLLVDSLWSTYSIVRKASHNGKTYFELCSCHPLANSVCAYTSCDGEVVEIDGSIFVNAEIVACGDSCVCQISSDQ